MGSSALEFPGRAAEAFAQIDTLCLTLTPERSRSQRTAEAIGLRRMRNNRSLKDRLKDAQSSEDIAEIMEEAERATPSDKTKRQWRRIARRKMEEFTR